MSYRVCRRFFLFYFLYVLKYHFLLHRSFSIPFRSREEQLYIKTLNSSLEWCNPCETTADQMCAICRLESAACPLFHCIVNNNSGILFSVACAAPKKEKNKNLLPLLLLLQNGSFCFLTLLFYFEIYINI